MRTTISEKQLESAQDDVVQSWIGLMPNRLRSDLSITSMFNTDRGKTA